MHINASMVAAGFSILLAWSCATNDSQSTVLAATEKSGKIDRVLVELHDEFIQHTKTHDDSEPFKAKNPQLRVVDGQV